MKAAKNLTSTLNLSIASPPSPKRPESRGNGNASSGSTTLSANSSPGIQPMEEDNVRRGESFDDGSLQSGEFQDQKPFAPYPLSIPQPMDGVSPRKKPRKQQL